MTVVRKHSPIIAALAAAAALVLSPLPALAGSFGITPLRVDLGASSKTAALTVRSDAAEPTVVQAELFVWEQQEGVDRLTPTRDLIVSPAVFTLQPSGSQLVRVGLRRTADATRELSYRLILTEVPSRSEPQQGGLAVALRLSLPVFVAPIAPAKPVLHWSVRRSAEGQLAITARNDGLAHTRILDFSLAPADGSAPAIERSVAAYVLPGQARTWLLGTPGTDSFDAAAWRALRLSGQAVDGPIGAEISLAAE